MDYEFSIEKRDGYLYAIASGYETFDNSLAVYEAILKKMIEENCYRVVYVEEFENQIPVPQLCRLMDILLRKVKEVGIDIRFAFYDRKEEHHRENILAESLAGAHGINIRVFPSEMAAIEWIQAC
ncbi:MAG TPA: hypothetical protein EYP40_05190 [Chromatiales bacterium]|nr:hypothetical protein [Chromatiales bacterium]